MFEKAEMCLGLWPLKSQPISRMAFTACSLTSLPGLMPALQTYMPRLADLFNMASAIGLRLALLMQTKSIFKISLTFRIDPSVWLPKNPRRPKCYVIGLGNLHKAIKKNPRWLSVVNTITGDP